MNIVDAYEEISAFLSNRIDADDYELIKEYDEYLRVALGIDDQ